MFAKVQELLTQERITLWEYHTPGEHATKLEELRQIAINATAKGLGQCHMDLKGAEQRIKKLRQAQASANAANLKAQILQDKQRRLQ